MRSTFNCVSRLILVEIAKRHRSCVDLQSQLPLCLRSASLSQNSCSGGQLCWCQILLIDLAQAADEASFYKTLWELKLEKLTWDFQIITMSIGSPVLSLTMSRQAQQNQWILCQARNLVIPDILFIPLWTSAQFGFVTNRSNFCDRNGRNFRGASMSHLYDSFNAL